MFCRIFSFVTLQLKNAKQKQLEAEAAKRHEEEILRAKAEKQQQPQQLPLQDHDGHNEVETRTQVDDSSRPCESTEQSTVPVKEQTCEVIQPTEADKETSVQTGAHEVSSSAAHSELVAADANKVEITAEGNVHEDAETSQRLTETDHDETEMGVAESDTGMQGGESSEKSEDLEEAAGESTVVMEQVPVVVVASSDGEVAPTAEVGMQSELNQPTSSQSYTADDTHIISAAETVQEEPSELPSAKPQLMMDTDKIKLEIADDVGRSVSDESSDAYTDVLEDETDHLSDILDAQDKATRKEDIEYVELCDESSSTVEPNANKEDNKEETEKELDSILDDVHLDESEHGNCYNLNNLVLSAVFVVFLNFSIANKSN